MGVSARATATDSLPLLFWPQSFMQRFITKFIGTAQQFQRISGSAAHTPSKSLAAANRACGECALGVVPRRRRRLNHRG